MRLESFVRLVVMCAFDAVMLAQTRAGKPGSWFSKGMCRVQSRSREETEDESEERVTKRCIEMCKVGGEWRLNVQFHVYRLSLKLCPSFGLQIQ